MSSEYLINTEIIPVAIVVFILGILVCFIGLFWAIKNEKNYEEKSSFKNHRKKS